MILIDRGGPPGSSRTGHPLTRDKHKGRRKAWRRRQKKFPRRKAEKKARPAMYDYEGGCSHQYSKELSA